MIYQQAVLLGRFIRSFMVLAALSLIAACSGPSPSRAAPYAAYVMDARTGETLYEDNSDTRLHPASLTKMMTLYIAFEEIERGNLSLDSMITVSKNAAAQPPSRLGLKAGQKIQLRYLIRAAAVKSANDAAQAIGDAIGGNQAQFADRMTRTAKSIGMRNTTFKNANGLTAKGHLSTAKDMSILGRHLFYDFPQYYNIFSRRSTDAGLATVASTNRKFLDAYKGADGIKTGYTQPAGFNLTASAERGGVRIIATVFGGASTPDRNARVSKLLDKGFAMVGSGQGGPAPVLPNADDELIANAAVPEDDGTADGLPQGGEGSAAKTLRVVMAVARSPRPMARPDMSEIAEEAEVAVAAMADDIAGALAEATGAVAEINEGEEMVAMAAAEQAEKLPFSVAGADTPKGDAVELAAAAPVKAKLRPAAKPAGLGEKVASTETPLSVEKVVELETVVAAVAPVEAAPATEVAAAVAVSEPEIADVAPVVLASAEKTKRKAPIYDDAPAQVAAAPQAPAGEVVTRVSTSGGKHWGINVGRYKSSDSAERILLKMQLVESATLGVSLRKVTQKGGGYDANFLGLSKEAADLACRRLVARSLSCITLGP